MIIFGWGHTTTKNCGSMQGQRCGNCNNNIQRGLFKVTVWFTLFFIPIIPYRTRYLAVCPICNNAHELSKEEFFALVEGNAVGGNAEVVQAAVSDQQKYAGKTETQINYLKQMEEARAVRDTE